MNELDQLKAEVLRLKKEISLLRDFRESVERAAHKVSISLGEHRRQTLSDEQLREALDRISETREGIRS